MSVQAQSWVIANSRHKGSELLLLLMIANHAHADGTNAFPSTGTLAKECRMSARQIRRLLRILEASGELITHRHDGKAHSYSIRMEDGPSQAPEAIPDTASDKTSPPASGGSDPGQDVQGTPDKMSPVTPDKMSEVPRTNSIPTPDIAMSSPPTPPYKDNLLNPLEHKPRVRARARGDSANDFGQPLYQPEKIGEHTLAEFRELLDAAAPHLAGEHPADVRQMWRSGTPPLEVVKCYNVMRMETWRTSPVTWKTVARYLPDWQFRKEKGIEPGKENTNYGKPKKIRSADDYAAALERWERKYDLAAQGRNEESDQPDQQDQAIAGLLVA